MQDSSPRPADPGALTVGAYLDEWLELQATRIEPSTWRSYRGTVRRYLQPALGDTPLDGLGVAQLDRLYVTLLHRGGRDGAPLSLRTVRYAHTVLHKALADARKVGLVARNVSDDATLPRIDPRAVADGRDRLQTWTAAELRALLASAAGDRLRWLWWIAAGTGMRRGELLGLPWGDVDVDAGTLRVRQALSEVHGRVVLKPPKTGRSRTLHLDAATIAAFRARREEQQRDREERGPCWRNDWDLVFTGRSGQPLVPDSVTRAFRQLVAAAPVAPGTLHRLRHTHATLLLEAGVPVKVVSERLGHATVNLTLNVYAHVLPSMDRDAVERFAAHVHGEPAP